MRLSVLPTQYTTLFEVWKIQRHLVVETLLMSLRRGKTLRFKLFLNSWYGSCKVERAMSANHVGGHVMSHPGFGDCSPDCKRMPLKIHQNAISSEKFNFKEGAWDRWTHCLPSQAFWIRLCVARITARFTAIWQSIRCDWCRDGEGLIDWLSKV